MTRPLPHPTRTRWQPLRAGLVDLFYYDSEEFWFRDGRLLLRGNNGTGKSKVLALTLPFLLDGELSPHRVEPDGDAKKRMEWNLLLGGAHPHPERLGYTWLEFGRRGDDGVAEYRTLGCGLKAVAGRGVARHWFFLTSLRVGDGLALVDATGTALTRERLAEALGGDGDVHDRARDYRRAVDEALFGFGPQRYGALVDLLVQLRQPQLSKRPNEAALSHALTEALPPLDQAVVSDVAEAFRSLEEDRDALAAMVEAHQATRSFLGHYRRYARIASRRRADGPRRAQSAYEQVNRELSEAQEAHAAAQREFEAAGAAVGRAEQERVRLQARDATLRSGPEMRSARELERAAEDAHRLQAEATRRSADRDAAATTLETRRSQQADAQRTADMAAAALDGVGRDCARAADAARIGAEHASRVDAALDTGEVPRGAATELADRQQRAIEHVGQLVDAADRARRELAAARKRVEELAAEAEQLVASRAAAERAVADTGTDLVAAVRGHLDGAGELVLDDRAAVLAALELWVETLDGPNPARAAADTAGHVAGRALARIEADVETRREIARRREAELGEEIARLEAGEHTAPPPPHTRDPAARSDRSGAPLWQLVDFTDDLAEGERAGLEAALEASGILDAWVHPDGTLTEPETHDVLLSPGPVPGNATLRGALRPAVDRADPRAAAVPDATLDALLNSVGLGDGESRVDTGGRFRIGVLEGCWSKPAACYIGRGAREAARRARLAQLRADLDTVRGELTGIDAEDAVLATRRRILDEELTGFPADDLLRRAHADVVARSRQRDELTSRQQRADTALGDATSHAEQAEADLVGTAGELDLPADAAGLAAVRAGLSRYREGIAALWPRLEQRAAAERALGAARHELAAAETELSRRGELAADGEREATAATERHRTLESTVGVAVAGLQRQLSEVARGLKRCEADRRAGEQRRTEAATARGKAEGRSEELTERLGDATAERAAAAESLRRFAGTGLLAVALPELAVPGPDEPWAPDPTVRLARQIDRELAETAADDDTWRRVQQRVTDELKTLADTLSRHGNTASAQLLDDGIVVDVVFHGRNTTVPALEEALGAEVGARQRLLDEREREILENHLINEVASTMQELISAADAQVAQMNGELADRPTSTGMRLRLLWRPREDGPPGLAAARDRLLRQTADAWSEEDRAAVGTFLQARIAEVRSADEAGTWLEHLTEALDYRAWHRFVIQRHQNGQWRAATGPASGGERVLAASVPLFAAASAHYASAANPHAPRVVTLDEAFAGVDDNARAKYLGLLAAFDLDVVMTSEREWGCYPEVPGLAIAQLSRTEDVAAVLVTSWEWDGRERRRVARPVPQLAMPEPVALGQDDLWS